MKFKRETLTCGVRWDNLGAWQADRVAVQNEGLNSSTLDWISSTKIVRLMLS